MASRPPRTSNPTSKVRDTNNAEPLATSSHRASKAAHEAELAAAAAAAAAEAASSTTTSNPCPSPPHIPTQTDTATTSLQRDNTPPISTDPSSATVSTVDGTELDSGTGTSTAQKSKKRKKGKDKATDNSLDADGMHNDVHVMDIESDSDTEAHRKKQKKKSDPTADVKHFFTDAPRPASSNHAHVRCECCFDGKNCAKVTRILRKDTSSQRRHMAAFHPKAYRKWCKDNNFESMLAEDSLKRKNAARDASLALQQTSIDDHVPKVNPEDRPKPYSDGLFKEAAIQWLIETDQPIQAFEHPAFLNMIDIASRATRKVMVPNRQQTREEIIELFKKQMSILKERLNSKYVAGEISITCDAWQASNTDAYFAVTGHWIEERTPQNWTCEHALLGFVQMNTAHDGKRLGQALFKVCDRLGIVHKIGHITCDNASNNNTMFTEFAFRYRKKTGKVFDAKRRIRCLAHIINLATQALISTRSKSKYHDPHSQDEVVPDVNPGAQRDELGLVRAIVVKARSSAQRKELFRDIQKRKQLDVLQLLLDMKVRWGSTYAMLGRAESRKDEVDTFVYEMGKREEDLEKRRKIDSMTLTAAEWDRVTVFCDLLSFADESQQQFSSNNTPSLHNALPAIETMHAEWTKRLESTRAKYMPFKEALQAAINKLAGYYDKTAESDAHIFAMVLNPDKKMSHFRDHWSDQVGSIEALLEKKFKERYACLNSNPTRTGQSLSRKNSRMESRARRRVDTDSEAEDEDAPTMDPSMVEFRRYLDTVESVPDKMDLVRWWGLNAHRYPTWASLARDYLAVMASSVSSERAFSAAGITISKRRNRLRADIVEALQCLKCMYHNDLIFREVDSLEGIEKELDEVEELADTLVDIGLAGSDDDFSWDQLVIDDD